MVTRCRQNYLVLVNPAGGTGNAKQLYETTASPLLYQSNIVCDVVITEFQHQATEIAVTLPLGKYDCVVAVGGDGLLSEGAMRGCVCKLLTGDNELTCRRRMCIGAWLQSSKGS